MIRELIAFVRTLAFLAAAATAAFVMILFLVVTGICLFGLGRSAVRLVLG